VVTILVPGVKKDGWSVDLSDSRTFTQDDAAGHLSAWNRLKQICEKERVYIVRAFLTVGKISIEIPGGKQGYWQAQSTFVSMDDPVEDPDRHWRGFGFVDKNGMVQIRWLAYPQARQGSGFTNIYNVLDQQGVVVAVARDEVRLASTQNNIIWSYQRPVPKIDDR
jgi:hypothetical protein